MSFKGGKALLSKINGDCMDQRLCLLLTKSLVFATSHLCPHYKAPLVKGTLSSDGRVMCPWVIRFFGELSSL